MTLAHPHSFTPPSKRLKIRSILNIGHGPFEDGFIVACYESSPKKWFIEVTMFKGMDPDREENLQGHCKTPSLLYKECPEEELEKELKETVSALTTLAGLYFGKVEPLGNWESQE